MKSVYLYLSTTTSSPNVSILNNSNLANVSWMVNWKGVFGQYVDLKKTCRVKMKLISSAGGYLRIIDHLGTIRCNFISSPYTNINNGFVLGTINLKYGYNPPLYYIDTDNLASLGQSIIIPNSNIFNIQMIGADERSLLTNIPDYNLYLVFEIDD